MSCMVYNMHIIYTIMCVCVCMCVYVYKMGKIKLSSCGIILASKRFRGKSDWQSEFDPQVSGCKGKWTPKICSLSPYTW